MVIIFLILFFFNSYRLEIHVILYDGNQIWDLLLNRCPKEEKKKKNRKKETKVKKKRSGNKSK